MNDDIELLRIKKDKAMEFCLLHPTNKIFRHRFDVAHQRYVKALNKQNKSTICPTCGKES